MDRYTLARKASTRLNEKNDCAVVAVSIATGAPYEEVHALMKKLGRKDRKGTPRALTLRALEELGFRFTREPAERYGRTVKSIAPALGRGTWLVRTRGHILCVVDGKAEDWTAGRRHRPIEVFKVEGGPTCPQCGQKKGPAHVHPEPEVEPEQEPEVEPAPLPEPPKKQTTRLRKVECQDCGYTARVTSKWLDTVGAPICPCNHEPMQAF